MILMLSEKRAKACIYCELDKICYERLQNIQETLLHSFFRNSSKSHEFEKRWKKCQNSWRFCAKSFFSLVRQNFSSHLRRCLMKQTNLPHPNKTQKLDKYSLTLPPLLQLPWLLEYLHPIQLALKVTRNLQLVHHSHFRLISPSHHCYN